MYERILVPLDGSSLSESVLPLARLVAKRLDSTVALLHVVEAAVEHGESGARAKVAPALRDATSFANRYLQDQAALFVDAGISVETIVLEGQPAQRIVACTSERGAGLILMATHGRAGIARAFLGSIARRVLLSTACPIVLLRPRPEAGLWVGPDQLGRVLVPLDGSRIAEAALPYAEEIAHRLGLPLLLVQVMPPDLLVAADFYGTGVWTIPCEEVRAMEEEAEHYLASIGNRLTSKGIKASWQILRGRAAHTIVDAASQVYGTLVVMTTHGRSGLQRWVLGSVTDAVVRDTGSPALIIRGAEEEG